jgi:hypothetical protein
VSVTPPGVVEGVCVSFRTSVVATAGALLLAVGAMAPGFAPSAAAATDPSESMTTYTVDPENGQVDVEMDLVPLAARMALEGPGEDHLYHVAAERLVAWVADTATQPEVTLAGAPLTFALDPNGLRDDAGYRQAVISVPAYQARAIRHVHVAYRIPGSGIRSLDRTRILADYAHLCVRGNGPLDGTVTIAAPAGFELDPLDETTSFSNASTSGDLTLSSGPLGDPGTFSECLNLLRPARDDVATVVTGGGKVTLRSWPGDTAWRTRVTAAIENAVPALVALVGRPVPGVANLTVREAVVASGYEGQYWTGRDVILLSEDITTTSITASSVTVAHELAHAWFNGKTDTGAWIYEGSAEWAARTAITSSSPCVAPASAGDTKLGDWQYLSDASTSTDLQAVRDEYETACAVVTAVANAGGLDRTRTAIQALMDKRDPYGASTPVKRTTVSWRDWLDAMDELAIYPNGGSDALAGSLLLKYGVTTDKGQLDDRLAARRAYHDLIRNAAPWVVPTAIRDPLSAWQFKIAQQAITTAADAYNAVAQADRLVPGSNASAGPIRVQWESAATQADLDAVLVLATAQRDAAKDVADAMAPLQSPLGFVPWVGQLGSTSSTLAAAKAAVGADNPAAAEAAAISLRAELLHYEAVGAKRIAIAVVIVFNAAVLFGLLLASLAIRRRARRPAPVPAPATAPILVHDVATTLAGGLRNPTLPPAPPAWFTLMCARVDEPPPAPTLLAARPMLPPMIGQPPGVPSSDPTTRAGAAPAAAVAEPARSSDSTSAPAEAPPPPAAR